ncbi:hypothetical protein Dsin_022655 [Dipteronia sinensis]|uniref:DAGKc domain-containing protein n=1 Tax=Dipteronia sinensis TaxID=43782 RepID=A0AAE0DZZ0_9ROSI|nr:hypothetical protein Dsin_022655 [Dipteronia sinensis]
MVFWFLLNQIEKMRGKLDSLSDLSSSPSKLLLPVNRFLSRRSGSGAEVEMDDSMLKDYCIPNYILGIGSEVTERSHTPACPVVVFINSKSGGQLGGTLLVTYRSAS